MADPCEWYTRAVTSCAASMRSRRSSIRSSLLMSTSSSSWVGLLFLFVSVHTCYATTL